MTTDAQSQGRRTRAPEPRSTAQWLSLAISLAVLAGVVGGVLVLWLRADQQPARFMVEPGAVRRHGDQFYLSFIVRNDGDQTASEVTVQGALAGEAGEATAATTFDFIPGRTKLEGVLIFSREPSEVSVRVVSYQKP